MDGWYQTLTLCIPDPLARLSLLERCFRGKLLTKQANSGLLGLYMSSYSDQISDINVAVNSQINILV